MACVCKCGKHKDCDEEKCDQCLVDELGKELQVTHNLLAGGRFYGEKLEKENE